MIHPSLKLCIPLLYNDKLKKEHLTKEAGLIGVYNNYSNTCSDTGIHLVYEYVTDTEEKVQRYQDLKDKSWIKNINCKKAKVNGQICLIYSISNTDIIRQYRQWKYPVMLDGKDKLQILNFWGTSDDDVNDFLLNGYDINTKFKYEEVCYSDEDIPSAFELLQDLIKEGITIKKTPRFQDGA